MKSVFVLLSLVALCQSVPWNSQGRIINGEEVKIGEIPYQVAITYSKYPMFCGGSILNEYYVLTAAQCFRKVNKEDLTIIAGTLKWEEPGSKHTIDKVIVHEKYQPHEGTDNYDIALARVVEPFVISETVGFARLIERDAHVETGTKAVVSGWGLISDDAISKDLMRVDVTIYDLDKCNATNYGDVHDNEICTFDEKDGVGACRGDSGGPLTVNGKIVGLVSWGIECVTLPTVYTRVSSFIDWIETHMD